MCTIFQMNSHMNYIMIFFVLQTMVIPEDQDGKTEDCLSLAIQSDVDSEVNTRKGGLPKISEAPNTVIVDMREFRSELPAILYTRGMKIEPVTLQV